MSEGSKLYTNKPKNVSSNNFYHFHNIYIYTYIYIFYVFEKRNKGFQKQLQWIGAFVVFAFSIWVLVFDFWLIACLLVVFHKQHN